MANVHLPPVAARPHAGAVPPRAAWDTMRRLLLRAAPMKLLGRTPSPQTLPPLGAEIIGRPRIVSGDTLEVNGLRVRIYGIDAPAFEIRNGLPGWRQSAGRLAARELRRTIRRQPVRATVVDYDFGHWPTILCRVECRGVDVGAELVRRGWAMSWTPRNSPYRELQREARAVRRGVWRLKPEGSRTAYSARRI